MLTKMKKKSEGFTIVEVMIVLAIAGMILLAVLLVVPSLNRTARNNRRRGDVSALLGAITEYQTNQSGSLPALATDITNNVKLSHYTAGDVTLTVNGTNPGATYVPGTDENRVYIATFAKCNGNQATGTGATRRNVIAYFYVESSGTPVAQCQET